MDQVEELSDTTDVVNDVSDDTVLSAQAQLPPVASQHHSLKHHLLGPSLTKAGQDSVDQKKVAEVIYEASKGSKYFNNEEAKDKVLTQKIERIVKLKAQLEKLDLKLDARKADDYISSLELSRDLTQYVVHIDCDAFYAAVEEIDRPDLKDVPMAVGVGVLTTCNYQARKFGCRSAMAGFVAKKLCPQLICLPLRFEKYTAKAKEVRAILAEYDPRFESSSIDEAYLNITEYCTQHDLSPEEAVQQMRQEVSEKCKITISAGIAPNAKLAKICSNKNKPNGQYRLLNDRAAVMTFMSSLPVRKVNGIGRVFERELQEIGVQTCGEIYAQRAYLNRLFGEKAFQFLMQTYLGLGRTDVQPAEEHDRKSVGTESTFKEISDPAELRERLRHTAEELQKDMARVEVKGRTLVLKVKLHTYEVFTRQVAPPKAICLADDLYNYSLPILAKLEKELPDFRLRLMGLRCTHLVSTKKAEVDFFRRKQMTHSDSTGSNGGGGGGRGDTPDEGEWEVWPDAEFEAAAQQERQDEFEEVQRLSQEYDKHEQEQSDHTAIISIDPSTSTADWHEPFGRYKYGSEPNSPATTIKPYGSVKQTPVEQYWDCPICMQPQSANDKGFNAHIDSCLSRQTIREAVAATTTSTTDGASPSGNDGSRNIPVDNTTSNDGGGNGSYPSRPRSTNGIKRKASSSNSGAVFANGNGTGRQKKLFFQ